MEKRLERVLNFGHAIDHLVLLIFPTAVIALAGEFGLAYETLLPLTFGCFAAFGVGALPAGWLGDRWGRRPMLLIFFFGTGVACLLAGLASTPFQIGVALTLIGAFASIYHPVGYAVLSGLDPARIGRIMGVNGLWGNLGVAFAALITGAITEWVSWRAAFFLPGIACLAGGIYYFAITRKVSAFAAKTANMSIPLATPLLVRVFAVLMALGLLGSLIFNATTVVMPKLFEQELPGLPSGTFGVGLMVCLVFSVAALAQTFVGSLMDRLPIRSVLLPVVAAQVPLLVLAGYTGGWTLVAVSLAMMFTIFGQAPICEVIVARYAPAHIRARVNALRFALTCGVGATAIPLAAYLYAVRQDFSLLFLVLGGFSVLVLVASLWMPGESRIAARRSCPPNRPRRVLRRRQAVDEPLSSSSNSTATSALADRRTTLPSTSATRLSGMKWRWPLWEPSPLSFFVSLMRLPSTLSTAPTRTPSAPMTSACSLICERSAIALLLGWTPITGQGGSRIHAAP